MNESFAYSELLCSFIVTHVSEVSLYQQQWSICGHLLDLLKVFNDATYTLSGVYYPTAHLFINECINISAVMQEHEHDDFLYQTIIDMKKKWCQYYKNIPLINQVATVFDPRSRLNGVKDYLEIYYEYLNLDDPVDIDKIISDLRSCISKLYDEYFKQFAENSPIEESEVQQSTGIMSRGQLLLMRKKKQPRVTNTTTEFDIYLTTSFEIDDVTGTGGNFKILDWWKQHARQFPILALIAKDLFASPVSTVAVEQAFSAGGSILDETRSSMSPESLEAQACLDDWCKANRRIQENMKPTNDYLFDVTEGSQVTTTTSNPESD